MLDALRRTADEYHRIHGPPRHWIVGASGGLDSTVLLHALARTLPAASLRAAHLHHGLRGPDADLDARFVTRQAAALGVGAVVERSDVAERARRDRTGVEAAGRKARHAFFRAQAPRRPDGGVDPVPVWLAHHGDDQAETRLFRWLRGGGWRGLGGMRPLTRLPAVEGGGPLILLRPWLEVPRDRLREYAAAHGLAWREDATNQDPRYTRNALRQQRPDLDRRIPGLPAALAALARDAARLDALSDRWADAWLARFAHRRTMPARNVEWRLPLHALPAPSENPDADLRGDPLTCLLRRAWERAAGGLPPDAGKTLRRLARVVGRMPSGKRLPLAHGGWLTREGGEWSLRVDSGPERVDS